MRNKAKQKQGSAQSNVNHKPSKKQSRRKRQKQAALVQNAVARLRVNRQSTGVIRGNQEPPLKCAKTSRALEAVPAVVDLEEELDDDDIEIEEVAHPSVSHATEELLTAYTKWSRREGSVLTEVFQTKESNAKMVLMDPQRRFVLRGTAQVCSVYGFAKIHGYEMRPVPRLTERAWNDVVGSTNYWPTIFEHVATSSSIPQKHQNAKDGIAEVLRNYLQPLDADAIMKEVEGMEDQLTILLVRPMRDEEDFQAVIERHFPGTFFDKDDQNMRKLFRNVAELDPSLPHLQPRGLREPLSEACRIVAGRCKSSLTTSVMIVGPVNSGKSTAMVHLLNNLLFDLSSSDGRYFGSVSPGDDSRQYVSCVEEVLRNLREATAGQPYVLVVNTTGWIKGLGLSILRRLSSLIEPTVVIETNPVDDAVRGAVGCRHRVSLEPLPNPAGSKAHKTGRMNNVQLRELQTFAAFAPLFCRQTSDVTPIPTHIRDLVPFRISFAEIVVAATAFRSSKRTILMALNASIVVLACTEGDVQNTKELDVGLKVVFSKAPPPHRALSLGFVRNIDVASRCLFLVAAQPEVLAKCNLLIFGRENSAKAAFLAGGQPADPYIAWEATSHQELSPSKVRTGLDKGLKLVSQFQRSAKQKA